MLDLPQEIGSLLAPKIALPPSQTPRFVDGEFKWDPSRSTRRAQDYLRLPGFPRRGPSSLKLPYGSLTFLEKEKARGQGEDGQVLAAEHGVRKRVTWCQS